MSDSHTKVIGYFAHSGVDVICTESAACVISGSRDALERHLSELEHAEINNYTIKKTRFGEILKGIALGAAYAFDKESYIRFYPLAVAEGLPVSDPSAFLQMPPGSKFLTVQIDKKKFPVQPKW